MVSKKKTASPPAIPKAKAAASRKAVAVRKPAAKPRAAPAVIAPSKSGSKVKQINMALQGGGAHGAFGWGVMDKFLEDGRVEIEGLSGTSAGSMNAVVYAYGKLKGNDGAREALHRRLGQYDARPAGPMLPALSCASPMIRP